MHYERNAFAINYTEPTIIPTLTTIQTATTTTAATNAKPIGSNGGGCFSGTSRVYREDGTVIMMKDLQVGDRLLDANGEYSPFVTSLDYQPEGSMTEYLQISTSESTLEMTPTHLLLMRHAGDQNPPQYLQAHRLHLGDKIFSIKASTNKTIKEMKVLQIVENVKRNNAFAPLTESGTLIVDDIVASCYADYEHQSLVQLVLFPFRLWHKIRNLSDNAYQPNELHPYIHFLLFIRNFSFDSIFKTYFY